MRCGQALVPMSEDRLRQIFAEGEPDWLEEPSTTGVGKDEIFDLLVQAIFQAAQQPYPTTPQGAVDRLLSERLIDGETGGTFSIRRMGAILLAKDIRAFPDVKRKAARVITYRGKSKIDTTVLDRFALRGYAVGFPRLVRFVNEQLPQNEVIKDALRKEVKLVPEIAVRELVANALVHQDFTIGGSSVMVEIYANRVEISNPGTPLVPVEVHRWLSIQQRTPRGCHAANGNLRGEEQRHRQGRPHGGAVSVAGSRLSGSGKSYSRDHQRTEGFQAYGPRGAFEGLLPALRPEMGHVGTHDQPVVARTIPCARRQERDRIASDCPSHRRRPD